MKNAERTARAATNAYVMAYSSWKAEDDKINGYIAIVSDCANGHMHEQLNELTVYTFITGILFGGH